MVETWPPAYVSYCNQYSSFPVLETSYRRLKPRCKSQSCSLFISVTHLIFGPNCSITSQYLILVMPPKCHPQVHGLSQPDPFIAGYRALWHGFTPVFRSPQSYCLFIGVIHLVSGPNSSILAQYLAWLWWKHDPRYILLYCNQWGSFPVVKACEDSFLYRCKSQSCSIFISVTPLMFGPNCSITSQYLA